MLVLALLHAYIGLRLVPDLGIGMSGAIAMLSWLIASTCAMPLAWIARSVREQPLSDPLAWVGLVAAGSFSSLFVLTVLRDVALVGAHLVHLVVPDVVSLEETSRFSARAVPLLTLAFTVVGYVNARRRARVRSLDVAIPDLPPQLEGFSIAQISDLHVGPTIKGDYVRAVVEAVNELEADMIAITGDLVDGGVHELRAHTRPLADLRARHGTYFVTGNHEYYSGAHAWIAELDRMGIRVLMNEHVVLERETVRLVVAGVTDYSAHHFDAAHRSDPGKALAGAPQDAAVKLLLAHQPRSALAAVEHGYDLQLSGHTHGGQFLPWNFFVRMQQPFTAGLHRLDRLWVYVSRGTGYWGPPKRLGAPSEITHLRLVRA
ncbi:MAG TPA: metallophosphoesterase [Casimicrobiaceae bacterium]|nr:metallophosphoesterase [Casimicrobiaceae bacterium]